MSRISVSFWETKPGMPDSVLALRSRSTINLTALHCRQKVQKHWYLHVSMPWFLLDMASFGPFFSQNKAFSPIGWRSWWLRNVSLFFATRSAESNPGALAEKMHTPGGQTGSKILLFAHHESRIPDETDTNLTIGKYRISGTAIWALSGVVWWAWNMPRPPRLWFDATAAVATTRQFILPGDTVCVLPACLVKLASPGFGKLTANKIVPPHLLKTRLATV